MPGSLGHLVRRFFDVLLSRPLTGNEVAAVTHWLAPDLAAIFFEQPSEDQRHGYHAALVVVAEGSATPDMIEAALLHDVGKRHANLGILGRSVASVLIPMGVRLSPRMTAYREHGSSAAGELTEAGASQLAIEFALHHHGSRPTTIESTAWDTLQLADQPPNPRTFIRSGISSTAV